MLTSECGWKGGDKSSACKESRSDQEGDELVPTTNNGLTPTGLLMEGQSAH